MASTQSYLDYILEQTSDLNGISYRKMMGEYVLYYDQKVVGGIYDDRFLLKPARLALKLMEQSGIKCQMELPYEGAKEMLLVDIDDRDLVCRLIKTVAGDLPVKTGKK